MASPLAPVMPVKDSSAEDEDEAGVEASGPVAVAPMSLAQKSGLEPMFVYGVKPDVRGGIFFGSDHSSLFYAAGSGVAKYNTKVFILIVNNRFHP